jgi:hypothetical protein
MLVERIPPAAAMLLHLQRGARRLQMVLPVAMPRRRASNRVASNRVTRDKQKKAKKTAILAKGQPAEMAINPLAGVT